MLARTGIPRISQRRLQAMIQGELLKKTRTDILSTSPFELRKKKDLPSTSESLNYRKIVTAA
jgi:hypothetical protein